MVTRCETQGDPQFVHEVLPDPAHELWASLTDNVVRDSKVVKHLIKKEFYHYKGGGQARERDKAQGLGKLVNDDSDGCIALGLRKVCEEILGNQGCRGVGSRMSFPAGRIWGTLA